MKGTRAAVVAVLAIALLLLGWWLFRRGSAGEAIDLLAQFDGAQKRPDAALFSVRDVELGGETKRAIAVQPSAGTRLIWKVRVPDDGWLRVYLGVLPDAWEQEGDGMQFRIGVSDGRAYEPLVTQHVHPSANRGDRKWIPVMVDLSTFSGEEVELILNTDASQPGKPLDQRHDAGAWAAPEIVIR